MPLDRNFYLTKPSPSLFQDVSDSHFSIVWTDRCGRPSCTCTTSSGSRRDCTEAFLSTTSAASHPRLWPSPPMSSWSRPCTWTNCHSHSFRSPSRPSVFQVTKQQTRHLSFLLWFVLKQGRNVPTFAQLDAAEKTSDTRSGNGLAIDDTLVLFQFPLHFRCFTTSKGWICWEHVAPIWTRL